MARAHTNGHWLRAALGLALGAALLYLSLRGIAWDQFCEALVRVQPLWLAASLASVVGTALVNALRWWLLLRHEGRKLRLRDALATLLAGQLANAVLPSRLGDVARAYATARRGQMGVPFALGVIVVEKALDGLVLAGLASGLALALAVPPWFRSAAAAGAAVFVALGAVVAAAALGGRVGQRWLTRLPARLRGPIGDGLRGLGALGRAGALWPAALLSLAAWASMALTNALLLRAFALPAQAAVALLVLAAIYLGAMVRLVPGQLGVFHYLTILALATFGIGRDAALPYAVVLHIVVHGPMVLLGAPAMWWLSVDWRAVPAQAPEPASLGEPSP